jgi:hypothetical protein
MSASGKSGHDEFKPPRLLVTQKRDVLGITFAALHTKQIATAGPHRSSPHTPYRKCRRALTLHPATTVSPSP